MSKNWIVKLYPKGENPYRKIIEGNNVMDVIFMLESKDGFGVDMNTINKLEAEELDAFI